MRSLVLQRYSAAAAVLVLAAAAAQVVNLDLALPAQHLRLAWTLTRVLLQL
ncbi:MAG: hypothetical protein ACC742_09495 [Thermoanaerobaculales bacterium]